MTLLLSQQLDLVCFGAAWLLFWRFCLCGGPQRRWLLRPACGGSYAEHHQGGRKSVRVHQLRLGESGDPRTGSHLWGKVWYSLQSSETIGFQAHCTDKVKILVLYRCSKHEMKHRDKWAAVPFWCATSMRSAVRELVHICHVFPPTGEASFSFYYDRI